MSLADIPNWVVYAVVGAIFGGLGGVFFKHRAAMIILVVISIQLSKFLFVPAFEQWQFRDGVLAAYNNTLPTMLDEITRFDRVSFDGSIFYGPKSIIYHYTLVDADDLSFTAETLKEVQDKPSICRNFQGAFQYGYLDQVVYSYIHSNNNMQVTYTKVDCG